MTRIINKDGIRTIIFEQTPEEICELCGITAELRPYGPSDENICYECGEKNEPMTSIKCMEKMWGRKLTTKEKAELLNS